MSRNYDRKPADFPWRVQAGLLKSPIRSVGPLFIGVLAVIISDLLAQAFLKNYYQRFKPHMVTAEFGCILGVPRANCILQTVGY
jgi:hypothetical protein